MYGITTVTTKGQVTIPEEVRTRLGIHVGDKIRFEELVNDAMSVKITVINKQDLVDRLYGSLGKGVKYVDIETARQKAGDMMGEYYNSKLKKWKK